MPYAPGISDISGQLRAQGTYQAARDINNTGDAFAGQLAGYQQKQEQNKQLLAQAKATESFIKSQPDLFGGQQVVDQLLAVDPKESPLQRYSKLASFTKEAMGGAEIRKTQQAALLAMTQAKAMAGELEQTKRDDAAFQQSFKRFVGDASGSVDPEVLFTEYAKQGGSPSGLQRMAPVLDAMIRSRAMKAAADAKGPAPEIKAFTRRGVDEKGNPTEQTMNALTGEPLGPPSPLVSPKNVLSPEELAQAAEMTDVARSHVKSNDEIITKGSQAIDEIPKLRTALALLQSPDVRTGTGANFEVAAKRLGKTLGFDAGSIADAEQLQSILGENILTKVEKMKGSLSDKDVKFLDTITGSMSKSNEGNAQILGAALKVQQRLAENTRMAYKLRAKGVREGQINKAIFDYNDENPIFGDQSQAAPSAPAASGLPKLEVMSITPRK